MSDEVATERRNTALIVRFNSPEKRSPLSMSVIERVSRILDSLTHEVSRLVFTGVDDVFASGADLKEIGRLTPETAREFAARGQHLMNRIARLQIPTVAAINGYCFGGALDLALACGRRVASPQAVFSHPGAGLGIVTGWGGTQRLPRLIGQGRSLEIFFTARRVLADEAFTIGLIDEIAVHPLKKALEYLS